MLDLRLLEYHKRYCIGYDSVQSLNGQGRVPISQPDYVGNLHFGT